MMSNPLDLPPISDDEQRRAAEWVADHIRNGTIDAGLELIREAYRDRRNVIAQISASEIVSTVAIGDKVQITDRISPRVMAWKCAYVKDVVGDRVVVELTTRESRIFTSSGKRYYDARNLSVPASAVRKVTWDDPQFHSYPVPDYVDGE
jgi:hypothetical protein